MEHRFVEFVPDVIEDGIVYISIPFTTAMHKCVCGCGNEVVTPFSPTDWKFIFDGHTISLYPSIGNWSFTCRSHYWIWNNQVIFAESWDNDSIQLARQQDQQREAAFYRDNLEFEEERPAPTIRLSLWQSAIKTFKAFFSLYK